MSNNNEFVLKVYKSRKTILNILKDRGYKIDDYNEFTISEIQILINNDQLDMLIYHNENKKKIYIKYYINLKIKPKNIYNLAEDIFNLEEILNKDDELIVITKYKLNDSIRDTLETLYRDEQYYINIFNINDYLFNITKHILVPKHVILTDNEKQLIIKKYNINNEKELPEISRFDPVSQALGIRPGELFEITRKSETAIETKYYRLCY